METRKRYTDDDLHWRSRRVLFAVLASVALVLELALLPTDTGLPLSMLAVVGAVVLSAAVAEYVYLARHDWTK